MKDKTSFIIHRNDGTSIIFAVFALIVLSILGLTIFSLVSTDIDSATSQILSSRALFAAEAGWQIGAQAVWDDKDEDPQTTDKTANGYYGISYLDGYFSDGVTDNENVCFHGTNWNNDTPSFCTFDAKGQFVEVWDFQQRFNLIGARAAALEIIIRAKKTGNGDQKINFSYYADSKWTKLKALTVTGTDWEYLTQAIKIDKLPSGVWQVLMSSNGNDFRIKAIAAKVGSRTCDIDWFALRVKTEVDALSEPWASNSYISLPAALGNASIESITASDESGKININYAPYNLMRRLLYHCGITPQSTANTLATNIVNYRTSNWFNTMEEIKQVTGMTDAYFDLIDQDITVYSWVNQDVMRPPDLPTDPPVPRASININTASLNVLKAVLKTATPGYDNDRINEIATAIKNQRDTQLPFTHMFSSYATQTNDTQSFAAFIEDLSVTDLTADRKNSMRNVADGSYYNRELSGDPNQNWFENDDAGGVEFCYYAHTFLIESTGRSGNIERTVIQTYGSTYNYSTYTFDSEGELVLPTYIGESSPKPYWREEH